MAEDTKPIVAVTPALRFRFYMRGWRHGASGTDNPLPENFPRQLQAEYQSGHAAGRNARRSTVNTVSRRLGLSAVEALCTPDTE